MQTYSHMVKLLVYLTQIIGLKKKKKKLQRKASCVCCWLYVTDLG